MKDMFFEEMEMPCPCDDCGKWFDLNDGRESPYRRGITICRECHDRQSERKELENQIEELQLDLDNEAEYTVGNRREYKKELKELKQKLKEYEHI